VAHSRSVDPKNQRTGVALFHEEEDNHNRQGKKNNKD